MNSTTIVQNLRNYCKVPRDHGMNHGHERFDHYRHPPLTTCQLFSIRPHLLPN